MFNYNILTILRSTLQGFFVSLDDRQFQTKILSVQRIFGFFDKWYEIFSLYFFLYILLVFFATILEFQLFR